MVQRPESAKTGEKAVLLVESVVNELNWVSNRLHNDFGVDLHVKVFESRRESREKEKALAKLGIDPNDRRGKENIEWSDCGYAATLSPLGLLNGLSALNMVAGARNQRYLHLWSGAA
jgi:hypothetical protein